ncbi:hypothetical protein ACWDYH_39720 [Nocardia goodfellowii]
MALNWNGTQRYYSCDNCTGPATQLTHDHGHYCNRCWFTYKVTTAEFQDILDHAY